MTRHSRKQWPFRGSSAATSSVGSTQSSERKRDTRTASTSGIWQTLRTGSALIVSTAVELDVAGPALGEILKGFAGLETIPVTDGELNRSITAYLSSIASTAETAEGLMGGILGSIGAGLTVDEVNESQVRMTLLSVADVDAEAKRMAGLDQAIILIAGDPEKILPQLAEIGLTDVTILPRDREP